MQRLLLAVLALAALSSGVDAKPKSNLHMGCHTWPVTPAYYGSPNLLPIAEFSNSSKLVATAQNGKLYQVTIDQGGASSPTQYFVAHVWGSPYNWGYALGTLYKGLVNPFITQMWEYMKSQVDSALPHFPKWLQALISQVGLEAALDFTYDATRKFTDPRIYMELQGLSLAGGVDYDTLRRVHMIAGLTQGKCSMLGAWGKALNKAWNGSLVQLRALDWDMDSPVRDYSAITVYHPTDPNDGHAHAMVGMVGFIGALTGVSETQLGISEIGVDFPDATFGTESRVGDPFIFVLRQILQYDNTIDDSLTRLADTTRTCDLILGVGDGKLGEFRSVAYSSSTIFINDDENMLPANQTWHPRFENIVYHGMDWACPSFNYILAQQFNKYYGQLDPQTVISYISAVEQSGSNHIAVYDLQNMEMFVSFAAPFNATGPKEAYARQYTRFDLRALFNEKPPSSAETE